MRILQNFDSHKAPCSCRVHFEHLLFSNNYNFLWLIHLSYFFLPLLFSASCFTISIYEDVKLFPINLFLLQQMCNLLVSEVMLYILSLKICISSYVIWKVIIAVMFLWLSSIYCMKCLLRTVSWYKNTSFCNWNLLKN